MDEAPRSRKRGWEASETTTQLVRGRALPRDTETTADSSEDYGVLEEVAHKESDQTLTADEMDIDESLESDIQMGVPQIFTPELELSVDGTDDEEEDLEVVRQEGSDQSQPRPFQLWPQELIDGIFDELLSAQNTGLERLEIPYLILSLGLTCQRFYLSMKDKVEESHSNFIFNNNIYYNTLDSDGYRTEVWAIDAVGEFIGPKYRRTTNHEAYCYDFNCGIPQAFERISILALPMFVNIEEYGFDYSVEEINMEDRYLDFEKIVPPYRNRDAHGNLIIRPKSHIIDPYNKGPAWSRRMFQVYLCYAGYLDVAYDVWYPPAGRVIPPPNTNVGEPHVKTFEDFCADKNWMRTQFYRIHYRRESLKNLADFLHMTGM